MRGDALQTFKNITSPNRENLGEFLTVFRRKYVKPQSMATAKHKFQRLVVNPVNQKLIDFLDELQKLAKNAFGIAAIIEQFIYAKMPRHLKKSNNQAHLENGTYEQIVSHLEWELELNGLEAPDGMPINTVTQQTPQQNSNKPRPTCHHCKKPSHYQNQCRQLKREKDQTQIVSTMTMEAPKQTLTPTTTKLQTVPKETIYLIKETEDLNLSFHPVRHVVELTTPQRNAILEQAQRTDRLHEIDDRKDRTKASRIMPKQLRRKCPSCSPSFKLKTPRLHYGAACDRPETNKISKLPPIPEVVWQQPTENDTNQNNLNNTSKDSTLPRNVASQTSPPKGTQVKKYLHDTEHPPGNQTGNELVPFLDCSKNSTNTQNADQHVVTTPNGDTTASPLTAATPLIEEGLVRDEQTNEIYLPLTSTVVLKRKQEMLYVPLDFENNLTVDALVDSRAFVSAIA